MFKIITVPFDRGKKGFDEELLNRFVLNKQIKSHHVEFFQEGDDISNQQYEYAAGLLDETGKMAGGWKKSS